VPPREEGTVEFPSTLLGFYETFPDEKAAWAYLRRRRWPEGFACPRCEGRRSYPLRARRLEQCAHCGYQASLTAGTIFHKTRVPLRTWFLAIFFVGRHKQGISALQLQRDSGLGSYRTAWALLHKVRSALGPDPARLLRGGVEADETYLGAPHEKGRRGGRAFGEKTLVGAVVERRRGGQLRLGVLTSHTFDQDLGPFVRGPSRPGASRCTPTDSTATGPWRRWAFATSAAFSEATARAACGCSPGATPSSRTSSPGCAAPSTG